MSTVAERPRHPRRAESDFSRARLLKLFTSAPKAFWRHDVDLDLAAAVKMARFAQVAGVSSTFYLNPRCEFYNVFSREGEEAIKAIGEAGHSIGLHCDYRDDADVEIIVRDQIDLLAWAVSWLPDPTPVSFHMPGPAVLWKDFEGFENAYAAKWEGRYLSDSRGKPLNGLLSNDHQINLHPEHWQL